MPSLQPTMSGKHRITIIPGIAGFLVLRLRQIPITFLGLIKMMPRLTPQP
jgi:hypothetical protein